MTGPEIGKAYTDATTLQEMVNLYQSVGGDWAALGSAERTVLYSLAASEMEASAKAWGVQLALDDRNDLPEVIFPEALRSSSFPVPAFDFALPALGVFPNPATDRVTFTFEHPLEDGRLLIYDPQGGLSLSLPVPGSVLALEVDLKDLAPGLYLAGLETDGTRIAAIAFTVVRSNEQRR